MDKELLLKVVEKDSEKILHDVIQEAKIKRSKLKIDDCKTTKKEFRKFMCKAINISFEHLVNKFGIFKEVIYTINQFALIDFLSIVMHIIRDSILELKIMSYCLMCLILSLVVSENTRALLKFIYVDWTLEDLINQE